MLLLPKALKNDAEIAGYYACHTRDGASLCAFFCWLEKHVVTLGLARVVALHYRPSTPYPIREHIRCLCF